MEEAQGQEEKGINSANAIFESFGWHRLEEPEDIKTAEFATMIKFVGGIESVTLAMCLKCAALVLPVDEIKLGHSTWHSLTNM